MFTMFNPVTDEIHHLYACVCVIHMYTVLR
jgi:hypothetical protein